MTNKIDWNDNAIAAAREYDKWLDKDDSGYIHAGEHFDAFLADVTTRPTEPERKTVYDAVEYYNGVWPDDDFSTIWISDGRFELGSRVTLATVCTREQFEAYVKEQEGEKWTHTYNENEPCKILIENPDRFGIIVIDTASNGYIVCEPNEIKPIKPTISKAEAWDKAVLSGNMSHITDNYEVK